VTEPDSLAARAALYLTLGSRLVVIGILLSGPLAALAVHWLTPQPAWTDPATYVRSFHRLQTLPYLFGFVLMAGNVLFVAAASRMMAVEERVLAAVAIVAVAVYGALIALNYIVQVAYIPNALSEDNPLLPALSMANPASLAWSLEMFGYAFLGVAIWLVVPAFAGGGRRRLVLRRLLVVYAILSLPGVIPATFRPEGTLALPGLAGYVLWNAVALLANVLVILEYGPETRGRGLGEVPGATTQP